MRINLILIALVLFTSCKEDQPITAQHIVNKSIETSGGKNYANFSMEFDFRKRHYISTLNNGNFEYSRITTDSVTTIIDAYGNAKPFSRTKNNSVESVLDSRIPRIENSINSVNYFVLLPYGLNDAAVNKTLLEGTTINGQAYYKIKVTFNQEGGGEDFEDVYIYWVNKATYKIDFLAYSFHVNGGGMRFREAFNERYVNGIRFVDYNNYKPSVKDARVEQLDRLFEKGQLKLLSKIETENVIVKIN